ncbi:MAG TPA: TlpA disulfide reductase family protein [Roseimicrobium sp.]|nr:TlpA disulfide reductase family protein [Roseimicrobium sp.]
MDELLERINNKLKDGKASEQDFLEDFKAFDVLIEKYKSQKTDEVASIVIMKAILYLQVLNELEKGIAVLEEFKTNFPDSPLGKQVDQIIESVKSQLAVWKIQKSLAVGTVFPNFSEKDLDGRPLSVSGFKGKVVLVDFWATWCGPCVRELPNLIQAYEKYHDRGFEIIGISLDENEQALRSFIAEQKMPWPQYFEKSEGLNKLATKYAAISIPTTYLLDREGKIIARNLRGEELDVALQALFAKKL